MMIWTIMRLRLPCRSGHPARVRPRRKRSRMTESSSVGCLERQALRDLAFPAVAVREQLLLVVEQLFARLGGEFEIRPLDDCIDRACLLAVAAIDALGHVDVVARGAPAAVGPRLGLD